MQPIRLSARRRSTPSACQFFNLAADPLEEYPLPKPENCSAYSNGTWTPADPRWHYCRLTEVVDKESFL